MNAQLQDRTAIVWGGAGDIGSTAAKAFAEAGAKVYLAGRTEATLAARAEEIGAAGYGVVDILDEDAVVAFVERVVAETGSLDISFNVADRGDIQGQALLEISAADYTQPVVRGITGSFNTARAAARQMVGQKRGVVIALDSGSARGSAPGMGGTSAADGALDALVRDLAAEVGPSGVRVVGIWTAGITETFTAEKFERVLGTRLPEEALEGIRSNLDGLRMTKRSPRLREVADTATFLASDGAGAITGTWLNVTSGMYPS